MPKQLTVKSFMLTGILPEPDVEPKDEIDVNECKNDSMEPLLLLQAAEKD